MTATLPIFSCQLFVPTLVILCYKFSAYVPGTFVNKGVPLNKKTMVLGATGQIGSELILELRKRFGGKNVIGVGIFLREADVPSYPRWANDPTAPLLNVVHSMPSAWKP